jgi:16S rRNA (uracil1498-N3)-methyltransferase
MERFPRGFRPRFFVAAPSSGRLEPGTAVRLDPLDERHARVVLRAREGQPCEAVVTTGPGSRPRLFSARFAHDEHEIRVVLEREEPLPLSRLTLLLLQAVTALPSVDLIIEKATEVGVDRFLLVSAAGSPKVPLSKLEGRVARWRRIATEAAKQSKQLVAPEVTVAGSLASALEELIAEGWLVAALDPGGGISLTELAASLPQASDVRLALAVGPESGWTEDEFETLRSSGAHPVRMGRRILRAETAGPVAAAVVRAVAGDW